MKPSTLLRGNECKTTRQQQDRTITKVLWEENHETYRQKITGYAVAIPLAASLAMSAAQADNIKIALAKTRSDVLAAFFGALGPAKATGLGF